MKLELTIKQSIHLICDVCKKPYDSPFVSEPTNSKSKYSLCPCCGREVQDPKDKNYQVRARRHFKKHGSNF